MPKPLAKVKRSPMSQLAKIVVNSGFRPRINAACVLLVLAMPQVMVI